MRFSVADLRPTPRTGALQSFAFGANTAYRAKTVWPIGILSCDVISAITQSLHLAHLPYLAGGLDHDQRAVMEVITERKQSKNQNQLLGSIHLRKTQWSQ